MANGWRAGVGTAAAPDQEPSLLRVETHYRPQDLPPTALDLCPDAGDGDLFTSARWLTEVAEAGLQPGDRLHLHVVTQDTPHPTCVALLPAVYSRLYGSHPGARVLHFLQREEQPYSPIGDGMDLGAVSTAIVRALADLPRPIDVVRVSPLDPDQPFAAAFAQALRSDGYWVQFYRHAQSRYANVAQMRFADYLAQRPRGLRESLDLNTRLLMQGGRGEFHYPCTPELVEDAWDSFCLVLSRAPQSEAPDPLDYLLRLQTTAAELGALRMGMYSLDGEPVAVQLWVLNGGKARCLRIWSAQGQRTFPVDDVLTQMMALCLIDGDHVEELEFGDIDEEFARDWAPLARERLGLAAFNRRTFRGVRGAARHIALSRLVSLPRRLWGTLTGK